jgi:hypothetical protein
MSAMDESNAAAATDRSAGRRRAHAGLAAALAFFALIGGCLKFGYQTGLNFSHGEHPGQIEDEPGYDKCVACHALDAEGRAYTLPSHQGATGCYGKEGGLQVVPGL